MFAVVVAATAFAPPASLTMPHTALTVRMNAAAAPALPVVSDKNFKDMVLGDQPVVLDFAADYCGPCRLIEPTLVRFNTQNDDIDVVKAKLDTNRELRIWLMQHGVKIAALPTLVLVRDGKPVRTLFGARDIMSEDKLHAFAFDESDEPPVTKPAFDPSAVFSAISSKMSKMRLAF